MKPIADVVTDKDAEECINEYTGIYRNLAQAQCMLSRENGKSPREAMEDVANTIISMATEALQRNV